MTALVAYALLALAALGVIAFIFRDWVVAIIALTWLYFSPDDDAPE